MKRVLQQVMFYLGVVIVAIVTVEVAYRINVLFKDPRLQLRAEKITELPPITAYTRSLWRFDADEGFQYNDRTGIFQAEVVSGRIVGCGPMPPISKDGSPGNSEGNYEDADLKIAVFGDSFSVFVPEGNDTWVSLLQRHLQEKIQRSVHVLNFARDGSGVVQMFDVAAAELPKRRPDLAIIAFNTDQMKMPRSWRVEKIVAGEPRVLTTLEKTENPNLSDHNSVYDTAILDPDIDAVWCDKNRNGNELDKVGTDLIDKYLRFRAPRYSALTLSRSFFWNRVVHADAFYAGGTPPIKPNDIENDLKLRDAVDKIRAIGTPLLLIHLPYSIEVAAGNEFSDTNSAKIAKAVSRITGQPVRGLINTIGPIERPERMNHDPSDMHPSAFGIELYARAVSKLIVEIGPLAQLKLH